jgi:alpha-L-rhamnosidase
MTCAGFMFCRCAPSWALYHMFASLLGIRPAAPGFRSVTIAPQLGPLRWLRGELPHPRGALAADLAVAGERLTGAITLPRGVTGVVTWRGMHQELNDGVQTIALDATSAA